MRSLLAPPNTSQIWPCDFGHVLKASDEVRRSFMTFRHLGMTPRGCGTAPTPNLTITDLIIQRFLYLWKSWNRSPVDTEGLSYFHRIIGLEWIHNIM